MGNLYENIDFLCAEHGVNVTIMCKDAGVSRAPLSDLKMGRSKTLSFATMSKISDYFGITVDELVGSEQKEKPAKHNDGPLGDVEIYRIERARKKMPDSEKKKMMQILELSFEEYFSDDYADTDTDE